MDGHVGELDHRVQTEQSGCTLDRVDRAERRVLSRFGDVFGPSVGLAARLSDEAAPGTVLLDAESATGLLSTDGVVLEPHGVREIAGVGAVAVVRLLDVV